MKKHSQRKRKLTRNGKTKSKAQIFSVIHSLTVWQMQRQPQATLQRKASSSALNREKKSVEVTNESIGHTGNLSKGGISFAIAPNEAGEWVEVSTQFELEAACMKENEAKFRQANNTPFMTSPLLDDFGYLPVGPNADSCSSRRLSTTSRRRSLRNTLPPTLENVPEGTGS
ncbi:MAG: hypothetical protein MZW92_02900 [Comamonadaceae bacterium]|nr:hypothetical protein [Comamonadaceae bacterium]